MIQQLYDEARLIADCRNDEVIADAYQIAEAIRLQNEALSHLQYSRFREMEEAAEQGGVALGNIQMHVDRDDVAFAVVGHVSGKTV
jgi:phosphoribosyl-AMP cyclohydrolase